MEYVLKASEIFFEDHVASGGSVVITGDTIAESYKTPQGAEIIDLNGLRLMPGLIDIHVHGGNGYDTMDRGADTFNKLSEYKIGEGVTSFCPSTVTAGLDEIRQVVESAKKAAKNGVPGAKIIGLFLEGPYINSKYKGAHEEEYIRQISIDEINEIIKTSGSAVKSFAIAPELYNAMEAIQLLTKHGIDVRIGHTDADSDTVSRAIGAGARTAIHTFNAMRPLSHREIGTVGAVLTDNRIYAELICDFIHVHPKAVQILLRQRGTEGIVLITDAVAAAGLGDGAYKLGGQDIIVKNGEARTPEGNLAGSIMGLIQAVKNMHVVLGVPLQDAVRMASENPARAVGVFDTAGSIRAGKKADLIAIDNDFNVRFVMIDGRIVRADI